MQTLHISTEGPAARITLSRPEKGNALDGILIAELTEAYQILSATPKVRVIALQGEGRHFCTGADLTWIQASAGKDLEGESQALANLFRTIAISPKATIAMVQGSVYGGGIGLLAAHDFVVAARESIFAFRDVRLGLVPGTIAPYVVRRIGAGKALQLMLTGRRFPASEAWQNGLVDEIARNVTVEEKTAQIVEKILFGGPESQLAIKEMINTLRPPVDEALRDYSATILARARSSAEAAEGIRAFFEKRRPDWGKINP
ncbi:MAG: enoyl-CoA hydratase-related protein [Bacteroidales bacterium]|nr:enoyl-CoA hydratase-related protein [Bacteroidales bacterium]MDD3666420.1 enoyl-CoA hydratase-related protein [Bacteroidales bacterium]